SFCVSRRRWKASFFTQWISSADPEWGDYDPNKSPTRLRRDSFCVSRRRWKASFPLAGKHKSLSLS
ncbi:MAG: hypothetical protein ACT6RE_05490, partial [Flavobacteriales bacterium]